MQLSDKLSKVMEQSKLCSLYVQNGATTANFNYKKMPPSENIHPGDFSSVEKKNAMLSRSSGTPEVFQVEDEERSRGMIIKPKRRHLEFTSPVCGQGKSPSSSDEAHVEGTSYGFVTARKKLVGLSLVPKIFLSIHSYEGLLLSFIFCFFTF